MFGAAPGASWVGICGAIQGRLGVFVAKPPLMDEQYGKVSEYVWRRRAAFWYRDFVSCGPPPRICVFSTFWFQCVLSEVLENSPNI